MGRMDDMGALRMRNTGDGKERSGRYLDSRKVVPEVD
jgi:hypothetical protein